MSQPDSTSFPPSYSPGYAQVPAPTAGYAQILAPAPGHAHPSVPDGAPGYGFGFSPPPVVAPKENAWSLAALLTGVTAMTAAFIPFVNYVAWIVAVGGIVLAIVALALSRVRLMQSAIGLLLSVVALILSIVLPVAYEALLEDAYARVETATGGTAQTEPVDPGPAAAAAPLEVTYEVIGDGGPIDMDYVDSVRGGSGIYFATDTPLPFTETVEFPSDVDLTPGFGIQATGGPDTTTLSCRVLVDGVVLATEMATGPYAAVYCRTWA